MISRSVEWREPQPAYHRSSSFLVNLMATSCIGQGSASVDHLMHADSSSVIEIRQQRLTGFDRLTLAHTLQNHVLAFLT